MRIDYDIVIDGLIPTTHFVFAYNIHVSDQKMDNQVEGLERSYKLTE